MTPTPGNWAAVLALGVVWGATFLVVELALRGYGPVTVAAARTGFGAAALAAFVAVRRTPLPPVGRGTGLLWLHLLGIGIFSTALPFFLLSWGQGHVTSAFAGLSMAAVPLMVLPLAHVFVPGEDLNRRRALGFALGFLGTLVLLGGGLSALNGDTGQLLGRAACLGAAASYAVGSIITRRCPPIAPIALAAMQLNIGAAILIPAMLLAEGLPAISTPTAMGAIVALGLIPTALAVLLRVHVIRTAGPGFMSLTSYQVPLWSMVFGWAILSEPLPLRFFAALALILAGLALSQRRR